MLGQGAQRSGERRRSSVLAGAFEALVAAIYLDRGLDEARRFVLSAVGPQLDAALPMEVLKAPKSRLQEHAYARSGHAPSYRVVSAAGPDHDRSFIVEVSLDGIVLGRGRVAAAARPRRRPPRSRSRASPQELGRGRC